MGVFSELDMDKKESPDEMGQDVSSFALSETADTLATSATGETFEDDARQQAEADTAKAALSLLNGEVPAEPDLDSDESEDQKKKEHEAQEAKRRAEWEEKQAQKKAAEEQVMQAVLAMTNDDVMNASVKRLGLDAERLTRRNMKMCVTEHIQTLCLDNPEFARKAMHPRKNMINCFKYINRHAQEYIKQEMEDNDEKPIGYAMGGDVPDDLCYQWAEDYFNDPDAQEDKVKEETFVPKPYYGKSASKKKKKEPAKKKEPPKPTEQPDGTGQMQLPLTGA